MSWIGLLKNPDRRISMSIKQITKDSTTTYLVYVCKRSRVPPYIKIQKQRSGLATLAEAKRAERQLEEQALKEIFETQKKGASWKTLLDKWYEARATGEFRGRTLNGTTALDSYNTLERYTEEWFKKAASDILPSDIRNLLMTVRESGKSWSRVRQIKCSINSVFEWGIESGIIKDLQRSPVNGITLGMRAGERVKTVLTLNQLQLFLKTAEQENHPYFPIWTLAAYTGARSGELFALTWKDIDFDQRRIMINKSYNGRLKTTKSTKSGLWREVPMNEELFTFLRSLKASNNSSDSVLPRINSWKKGEAARETRKFLLGIGLPQIRFHDLRAIFATLLLRNGVPTITVMKIAGWKDLKTMQHYVRLAGVEIEGATDSLNLLPPKAAIMNFPRLSGSSCPT